jgi:hypothetical protein
MTPDHYRYFTFILISNDEFTQGNFEKNLNELNTMEQCQPHNMDHRLKIGSTVLMHSHEIPN